MTVRKMYNLNYSIITKLQHYKTIKNITPVIHIHKILINVFTH